MLWCLAHITIIMVDTVRNSKNWSISYYNFDLFILLSFKFLLVCFSKLTIKTSECWQRIYFRIFYSRWALISIILVAYYLTAPWIGQLVFETLICSVKLIESDSSLYSTALFVWSCLNLGPTLYWDLVDSKSLKKLIIEHFDLWQQIIWKFAELLLLSSTSFLSIPWMAVFRFFLKIARYSITSGSINILLCEDIFSFENLFVTLVTKSKMLCNQIIGQKHVRCKIMESTQNFSLKL